MNLEEIKSELQEIRINDSEDYYKLDRIDFLCDLIQELPNGHLACQTLIKLLERHPNIYFGSPGTPVHTLERFIGHYEQLLFASLNRSPTEPTIWMLNRIINSKNGNEKEELIELLKQCSANKLTSEQTRESAKEFLEFQLSN